MSPQHRRPADPSDIRINSGVSAFTGDGFVTLKWGESAGQLTPAEARAHALAILEAAEAAESDAAVWQVMTTGGATEADAVRILSRIRDARG